eukprot:GFKZ01008650.1.p1 GENE.GFKZ01008650.1~~GFKZ01008650.1.p1  ORF type:complete len:394 (-),score=30.76 GFKZ01008650.1:959-2140(-)
MAFLPAPRLAVSRPFSILSNYRRLHSTNPRHSSSTSCSAQTPTTPPASYRPRTSNFFNDAALSRPFKPSFPTNIDQLLKLVSPADRFIPIWNDRALLETSPPSIHPVFWTPSHLSSWLQETRRQLTPEFSPLLVSLAHTPPTQAPPVTNYFAIDVSSSCSPPLSSHQSTVPLRKALPLVQSETHATLLAHANALISWHHSAAFCSRCGKRTAIAKAGMARVCNNSLCRAANIYPRVMPSVMVLVLRRNGQQVLLGRKASWAPGRYSVLAGYAEIFESLEQTVAREVWEETGVHVDSHSIVYHSSQPWPSKPHASLMSAFRAYVTRDEHAEINVDEDELEDARWFEKASLRKALLSTASNGTGVSIPGPTSLANRLIWEWLNENVDDDKGGLST